MAASLERSEKDG